MKSDKDMRGGFNNFNIGPLEILEEENRINIQMSNDWEFFTTENLEKYLQWVHLTKISTLSIYQTIRQSETKKNNPRLNSEFINTKLVSVQRIQEVHI